MATIQDFYTVAQNKDFARLFQFRLISFGNIQFDQNHFAYVESAALPGRSITNIPITYMGLDFNTPGTVKYPGSANYAVNFRCDQMYDIRSALEAATFNIFDESTSQGSYGVPGDGSKLILELYDRTLRTVRTYTLFGVWVQSLGDVNYDVKDTGNVQTVAATLAYQYWRAGDGNIRVDNGRTPFASSNRRLEMVQTGAAGGAIVPAAWGAREFFGPGF